MGASAEFKCFEGESQQAPGQCTALDGVVWKKLDRCVLPLCTCIFVLDALNRASVGNARVAGMQKSLDLSNFEYTVALTATYVSYICTSLPIMLVLKHVGPTILLPVMVVLHGIVASLQGIVKNYDEFLACRFLLGMAEGGVIPGVILYLSLFYPRRILQARVANFHAWGTLSGAFSGLLATAIENMNGTGGRPGWAWIFILEGILSIVIGLVSFLLPRTPEMVRSLTESERAYVVSALKRTGAVSEVDEKDNFSWTEVANAFKSLHMWLMAIISFFGGTMLFGLAFFEPTIVAGLGYKDEQAQLMSAPPFAVAFVLTIVAGIVSDRYRCRGYVSIFFATLGVIGFSAFYASTSNHVRYVSIFFSIASVSGVPSATITWLANNSAPYTRRASSMAVTFILSQFGGIFSTWLLGFVSGAPNFTLATIIFIVMSIGTLVLSAANLMYLSRQNRLKAEKRRNMEKKEEASDLGDRSAWFIYSL